MRYTWTQQELWCTCGQKQIYGKLYRPQREEPIPLLIFSHELCRTHATGEVYAEALAEEGIATYTFDYPGGSYESKSTGDTKEMSVLTEVEDLTAVLMQACTWSFVDPEKILLMGGSQGGLVAAITAARHPRLVRGLILMYAAFSISDEIHRIFPRKEDIPEEFRFFGWIDVGRRYGTDMWDYDGYGESTTYDKPVLILHGDRDHLIPDIYSRKAAALYLDSEFHMVHEGGHGFSRQTAAPEALVYIKNYIRRIGI